MLELMPCNLCTALCIRTSIMAVIYIAVWDPPHRHTLPNLRFDIFDLPYSKDCHITAAQSAHKAGFYFIFLIPVFRTWILYLRALDWVTFKLIRTGGTPVEMTEWFAHRCTQILPARLCMRAWMDDVWWLRIHYFLFWGFRVWNTGCYIAFRVEFFFTARLFFFSVGGYNWLFLRCYS